MDKLKFGVSLIALLVVVGNGKAQESILPRSVGLQLGFGSGFYESAFTIEGSFQYRHHQWLAGYISSYKPHKRLTKGLDVSWFYYPNSLHHLFASRRIDFRTELVFRYISLVNSPNANALTFINAGTGIRWGIFKCCWLSFSFGVTLVHYLDDYHETPQLSMYTKFGFTTNFLNW